jgi:hypothetical protein
MTLGWPVAPFVAATLSGGIFGDHSSPISDTTIISSMAAATDHIDHVRTQLPYAMIGGGVAVIGFALVGSDDRVRAGRGRRSARLCRANGRRGNWLAARNWPSSRQLARFARNWPSSRQLARFARNRPLARQPARFARNRPLARQPAVFAATGSRRSQGAALRGHRARGSGRGSSPKTHPASGRAAGVAPRAGPARRAVPPASRRRRPARPQAEPSAAKRPVARRSRADCREDGRLRGEAEPTAAKTAGCERSRADCREDGRLRGEAEPIAAKTACCEAKPSQLPRRRPVASEASHLPRRRPFARRSRAAPAPTSAALPLVLQVPLPRLHVRQPRLALEVALRHLHHLRREDDHGDEVGEDHDPQEYVAQVPDHGQRQDRPDEVHEDEDHLVRQDGPGTEEVVGAPVAVVAPGDGGGDGEQEHAHQHDEAAPFSRAGPGGSRAW